MYIIAGTLWSLGSWIQIGRDKAIEVLGVDTGLAGVILANVHQPQNMGCCGKKKVLMIMTSICACASFAFLCIAVATDYWLFAIERVMDENGTSKEMHTYTGLWRKCILDGKLAQPPSCFSSTIIHKVTLSIHAAYSPPTHVHLKQNHALVLSPKVHAMINRQCVTDLSL